MEVVLSVFLWWIVSFVLVALFPTLRALRGAFMMWQAVTVCGLVGAADAPTLEDIQAALDADAMRVEQPAQRKPRAKRGGRPRLQREPLEVSWGTLRVVDLAPRFACYLGTDQARKLAARAQRLEARADKLEGTGKPQDSDKALRLRDEAQGALDALWGMMEARAGEGLCFGAHEGDGSCFGFWPVEDDY